MINFVMINGCLKTQLFEQATHLLLKQKKSFLQHGDCKIAHIYFNMFRILLLVGPYSHKLSPFCIQFHYIDNNIAIRYIILYSTSNKYTFKLDKGHVIDFLLGLFVCLFVHLYVCPSVRSLPVSVFWTAIKLRR